MEHSQLQLRSVREKHLEHSSKTPYPTGEEVQEKTYQQEKDNTHNIEKQMDKSCPFGISSAGDTGNNRHHAGTDVRAHRQIDALVKRQQPRHHHGDGDTGHYRRGLDDGRKQGSQKDDQQRIAHTGQKGFHRIVSGKFGHGP